jgi:hypothetical protein
MANPILSVQSSLNTPNVPIALDGVQVGASTVNALGKGKELKMPTSATFELQKGVQLQHFGEKGAIGLVKPDGSVLILSVGVPSVPSATVLAGLLTKAMSVAANQGFIKRKPAPPSNRLEVMGGANGLSRIRADFTLADALKTRVRAELATTSSSSSFSVSTLVPVAKVGNAGKVTVELGLKNTSTKKNKTGDVTAEVALTGPLKKFANGDTLVGGVAVGHNTIPYATANIGYVGSDGKLIVTATTIASRRLVIDGAAKLSENLAVVGQVSLPDAGRGYSSVLVGGEFRF